MNEQRDIEAAAKRLGTFRLDELMKQLKETDYGTRVLSRVNWPYSRLKRDLSKLRQVGRIQMTGRKNGSKYHFVDGVMESKRLDESAFVQGKIVKCFHFQAVMLERYDANMFKGVITRMDHQNLLNQIGDIELFCYTSFMELVEPRDKRTFYERSTAPKQA